MGVGNCLASALGVIERLRGGERQHLSPAVGVSAIEVTCVSAFSASMLAKTFAAVSVMAIA